MKKILIFALAGILVLSLAACAGNTETTTESVPKTEKITKNEDETSEKSSDTTEKTPTDTLSMFVDDTYTRSGETFEISIVTPQVTGLKDKVTEDALNQKLTGMADAQQKEADELIDGLIKEQGEAAVRVSYLTELKAKGETENYISFDYTNTIIRADSSEKHTFFVFDKTSKEEIDLRTLFSETDDYVNIVSQEILAQMQAQIDSGEASYFIGDLAPTLEEAFTVIKPDQNFYINDDGKVVICFDQFEVAAGYMGSPEFVISQDI